MFEKLKSLFREKKKNDVVDQPKPICEIKPKPKVAEQKIQKCKPDNTQKGMHFFLSVKRRRAKERERQRMNKIHRRQVGFN